MSSSTTKFVETDPIGYTIGKMIITCTCFLFALIVTTYLNDVNTTTCDSACPSTSTPSSTINIASTIPNMSLASLSLAAIVTISSGILFLWYCVILGGQLGRR